MEHGIKWPHFKYPGSNTCQDQTCPAPACQTVDPHGLFFGKGDIAVPYFIHLFHGGHTKIRHWIIQDLDLGVDFSSIFVFSKVYQAGDIVRLQKINPQGIRPDTPGKGKTGQFSVYYKGKIQKVPDRGYGDPPYASCHHVKLSSSQFHIYL